ncbi:hypothetical protein NPIL_431591, partial [Nephila pilipes]
TVRMRFLIARITRHATVVTPSSRIRREPYVIILSRFLSDSGFTGDASCAGARRQRDLSD